MFVTCTTMRGEAVAINVAAVSYVAMSRSGTVVVLADGNSFNVRDDYAELVSAIEKTAGAKTA